MPAMNDEDELFSREMTGVAPIARKQRVDTGKRKRDDQPGLAQRRRAAVTLAGVDRNFFSTEYAPLLAPMDLVEFHRPGIQHGVLRKLRLGQYPLEATLDLHRRSVDEARVDVFEFLQECVQLGLRSVLVSHGKGGRDGEGRAMLKSYCAHWLPQVAEVLAVHTAQQRHGGYGALYVLLKKGEKARNENRERFGRRAQPE